MPVQQPKASEHPLLETLLAHKGLALKGTYTVRDVAKIFDVSTRTIQVRVKRGDLKARDLPGRARFLAADLEAFLERSARAQTKPTPPSVYTA